jgi:antitoxin (DNA-binding transcriptional repressor) of toxin-antitoxin stability system
MDTTINAKRLRATLPDVVSRVRKGARFTVLYRSRPAFRIVPMEGDDRPGTDLAEDALYRAGPVGRSRDGHSSRDHDTLLYGR